LRARSDLGNDQVDGKTEIHDELPQKVRRQGGDDK